MKKRIVAAIAALCMTTGTSAFARQQNKEQKERPTAEQIAQAKTDRIAGKLQLDRKQIERIYELNLRHVQAEKAARAASLEARKAEEKHMKSILTSEQYEKWSQLRASRHNGPKGPQAGGRHGKKRDFCKSGKEDGHRKGCGPKETGRHGEPKRRRTEI